MKKFIITLLLLFIFLLTGFAQVSSSYSNHEGKSHRGQNSRGKGDRHRKGIGLFHGHHHHKKDHAKSDDHSHHCRKGHDKDTKGNK
jgi:hypothetical protein